MEKKDRRVLFLLDFPLKELRSIKSNASSLLAYQRITNRAKGNVPQKAFHYLLDTAKKVFEEATGKKASLIWNDHKKKYYSPFLDFALYIRDHLGARLLFPDTAIISAIKKHIVKARKS